MIRPLLLIASAVLVLAIAACGGAPPLMPPPNLYTHGDFDPFADVPQQLRNSGVDVIYLTDRQREDEPLRNDAAVYRYDRSRSVAFGLARVEFGHNVTWDQLCAACRKSLRAVKLPMTVTRRAELGRFPPTPRTLFQIPSTQPAAARQRATATTLPAALREEQDQTMAKANELLSESEPPPLAPTYSGSKPA